MSTTVRWTSADLLAFSDDIRREIIDGELYVSSQPRWFHQVLCNRFGGRLDDWSVESGLGLTAGAPGLIFAEDQDVAPMLSGPATPDWRQFSATASSTPPQSS